VQIEEEIFGGLMCGGTAVSYVPLCRFGRSAMASAASAGVKTFTRQAGVPQPPHLARARIAITSTVIMTGPLLVPLAAPAVTPAGQASPAPGAALSERVAGIIGPVP
jgi:hypothetical protein